MNDKFDGARELRKEQQARFEQVFDGYAGLTGMELSSAISGAGR
jgi:hypothetical protein